jgi:sugar phosphate isomerase/epimerase
MFLGISTIIFEGYENIEPSELESVKKAGFDYIEVSPYHEITPRLKQYIDSIGIKVFSMHADYLNTDASSEDKKIRLKTLKIYKDTLIKAKELGSIGYDNAFIFELMRENTREKDIYKILSGVKEFLKYHEDLS